MRSGTELSQFLGIFFLPTLALTGEANRKLQKFVFLCKKKIENHGSAL